MTHTLMTNPLFWSLIAAELLVALLLIVARETGYLERLQDTATATLSALIELPLALLGLLLTGIDHLTYRLSHNPTAGEEDS